MDPLLVIMAIFMAATGFAALATFGLPWALNNWPRFIGGSPKTPAAILAKAMSHPATIGDWRKDYSQRRVTRYVNDKMGVSVRRTWLGSGDVEADFPVSWRDQKRLNCAARAIDAHLEGLSKIAALNDVTDRLDRAYGDGPSNVVPIGSASRPA